MKSDNEQFPAIYEKLGQGCSARVACQQSAVRGRVHLDNLGKYCWNNNAGREVYTFADGSELIVTHSMDSKPHFAWSSAQ